MSSYADIAAKGPKQTDAEKVPDAVPEILHEDSGVHSLDAMSANKPTIPSYADQQRAKEKADESKETAEDAAGEVSQEALDFADKAERDLERLAAEGTDAAKDASKDIRASLKRMRTESSKQFEKTSQDVSDHLSKLSKDGSKQYQQFADSTQESLKGLKANMAKWDKDAAKKLDEFSDKAGKQFDSAKKDAKVGAEKAKKNAADAEAWTERNKGNPVVVGNTVALAAIGTVLGVGAFRMHRAGTLTWNVAGTWAGALALFAVGDYYVSQFFFKKYPPK